MNKKGIKAQSKLVLMSNSQKYLNLVEVEQICKTRQGIQNTVFDSTACLPVTIILYIQLLNNKGKVV